MYDDVSKMKGLTLASIDGMEAGSECVTFKTACGRSFTMWHAPD